MTARCGPCSMPGSTSPPRRSCSPRCTASIGTANACRRRCWESPARSSCGRSRCYRCGWLGDRAADALAARSSAGLWDRRLDRGRSGGRLAAGPAPARQPDRVVGALSCRSRPADRVDLGHTGARSRPPRPRRGEGGGSVRGGALGGRLARFSRRSPCRRLCAGFPPRGRPVGRGTGAGPISSRRTAAIARRSGSVLEEAALAIVLGCMIAAKVLSPQFVLWVAPLLALVAKGRPRRCWPSSPPH